MPAYPARISPTLAGNDINAALARMRAQIVGAPEAGGLTAVGAEGGDQMNGGYPSREAILGALPPRLQAAVAAGRQSPESALNRFGQFQAGQLPGQQQGAAAPPMLDIPPDLGSRLPPELMSAKPMPFPTYDPNNQQGNNQGPPVGMRVGGGPFIQGDDGMTLEAQPLPLSPAGARPRGGPVAAPTAPTVAGPPSAAAKPIAAAPPAVGPAQIGAAPAPAAPPAGAMKPAAPVAAPAQPVGNNASRINSARNVLRDQVRRAMGRG